VVWGRGWVVSCGWFFFSLFWVVWLVIRGFWLLGVVLLNFLWIVPGFGYKVFDMDEIEAEK